MQGSFNAMDYAIPKATGADQLSFSFSPSVSLYTYKYIYRERDNVCVCVCVKDREREREREIGRERERALSFYLPLSLDKKGGIVSLSLCSRLIVVSLWGRSPFLPALATDCLLCTLLLGDQGARGFPPPSHVIFLVTLL